MNQYEYAALSQEWLSHEARTLYVMCLRRHMDYGTGIVGEKRGISFQMFQEHLEVKPKIGSTREVYIPTRNAVRNMEKQLIQAGLIAKIKRESRFDRMCYRLPLATIKVVRLNEEQQGSNHGGTTTGNSVKQGVAMGRNNKGTTTEEQPTSVTSVNTLTVMQNGWLPGKVCTDQLRLQGVPKEFIDSLIEEFTGYWITSGKAKDWNTQFYSHVKYKWVNRHETRKQVSGQKDTFDLSADF